MRTAEPEAPSSTTLVARRRSSKHGYLRRVLRFTIHSLSYHFILSRPSTSRSRTAGFSLIVRPTVFHPRYFLSSAFFAEFIDRLDMSGCRVADVGTGSGILALAAARSGADYVIALDINPAAAMSATENARNNGFTGKVIACCGDLLESIAPAPVFDIILSSPPKHAGEPRNIADRAWHAGPGYRDISSLFAQARERLTSSGRLYVMLSSDSDLDLIGSLIHQAGLQARVVYQRSILIESLIIYEVLCNS